MLNCTVAPPLCFSVNNSSLPSQFALPHLRKTEGNIINVSSLVATIGQVGAVPYVATKVSSRPDCSRTGCFLTPALIGQAKINTLLCPLFTTRGRSSP